MGFPNEKHAATPAVVQRHYGHIRMAALSLAGALPLPPLNGQPAAPQALPDVVRQMLLQHADNTGCSDLGSKGTDEW